MKMNYYAELETENCGSVEFLGVSAQSFTSIKETEVNTMFGFTIGETFQVTYKGETKMVQVRSVYGWSRHFSVEVQFLDRMSSAPISDGFISDFWITKGVLDTRGGFESIAKKI
jgi:hypothetical protein